MEDKNIKELLDFDPLDFAERATGKDLGDEGVTALGFGLHQSKNEKVREIMVATKDSHFGISAKDFLAVLADEGFVEVLRIPFKGRVWRDEPAADEMAYTFWKASEGLLLHFDTHDGQRVNSGHVWYCWKPREKHGWRHFIHSGGIKDGIWCGYHDVREALRFNLRQLRENGTFVTDWPADHMMLIWLSCYTDWPNNNRPETAAVREARVQMIEDRIKLLPEDVQKAIKGARG